MNAPTSNILHLADRRAKKPSPSTGCARALHDTLAEEFASILSGLNLKCSDGNDIDVGAIAASLADVVLPVRHLPGGH